MYKIPSPSSENDYRFDDYNKDSLVKRIAKTTSVVIFSMIIAFALSKLIS